MTPRWRISVAKDSHKFSCAHMTVFPDGTKERIHGHNFTVGVCLELARTSPLIDFADVKRVIQELCGEWSERLLVPGESRHFKLLESDPDEVEFLLCTRRYVLPADEVIVLPIDNVVVENLAALFAEAFISRARALIDMSEVRGVEVTVSESPGQSGIYHLSQ